MKSISLTTSESPSLAKWMLYILFASIPFLQVILLGHISVMEIMTLITILVVLNSKYRVSQFKMVKLDVLIILYALIYLLSVAVGIESIYFSLRYYKYLVLVPVLIYFAIRLLRYNANDLFNAMHFLIFGVFFHSVNMFLFYLSHGRRPVDDNLLLDIVTYAMLAVISIIYILYARHNYKTKFTKIVMYMIAVFILLGLVISATRAALIGMVLFVPLIYLFWSSRVKRNMLKQAVMAFVVLLCSLIVLSPALFTGVDTVVEKDDKRSIERVVNVNLYVEDIQHRLLFWNKIAMEAFKTPIFGRGMSGFSVGRLGGTSFDISSSHNALVSAFVTAGLPGFVLLVSIFYSAYSVIVRLPDKNPELIQFSKFSFASLNVFLFISVTNDLSSGRAAILLFLSAVSVRCYYSEVQIRTPVDNSVDKNADENNKYKSVQLKK